MLTLNELPYPTSSSPLTLRQSSLSVFQRCPREFKHRFVDGIEAKLQLSDEKLEFGTTFAKILELNALKPVAAWEMAGALRGLDTELAARLAGATTAYATYWGGSLKYRATELQLVTPLPGVPEVALRTTLDGLVEDETGDLAVVDQKTTSSDITPGSWFWEKLQIALQPGIYLWAARANGHPVTHAIWDAVKRPTSPRRTTAIEPEYYKVSGKWGAKGTLKPGTGVPAETVPEYAARIKETMLAEPAKWFQRAPVVRMEDETAACVADVEQSCRQVLYAIGRSEYPRNTNSCFTFGRRCEYWSICVGETTARDDTLYQIRKEK